MLQPIDGIFPLPTHLPQGHHVLHRPPRCGSQVILLGHSSSSWDSTAAAGVPGLIRQSTVMCTAACGCDYAYSKGWQLVVFRRYTVRLEADKAACPVLLSNGKCTENGDLPNGW